MQIILDLVGGSAEKLKDQLSTRLDAKQPCVNERRERNCCRRALRGNYRGPTMKSSLAVVVVVAGTIAVPTSALAASRHHYRHSVPLYGYDHPGPTYGLSYRSVWNKRWALLQQSLRHLPLLDL
jgi:hypothetical protein